MLGAEVFSFACTSPVGGMLFGVSGLLLLLLLIHVPPKNQLRYETSQCCAAKNAIKVQDRLLLVLLVAVTDFY